MHLIKRSKKAEPKPFIPIISHWAIPGHRKMRGKRYNAKGECIGPCGPRKPIPDPRERERLLKAIADAQEKGPPVENAEFDIFTFTPLAGRVLVVRGPMIKEENGVLLPENRWRHEPWWVVIRIGEGVASVAPGDRIVFSKGHRPKEVWIGRKKYYAGREGAIAALLGEPE